MGSWSSIEAAKEHKKYLDNCIAMGGTVEPDPMFGGRCIPGSTTTHKRLMESNTTIIILVVIIVVLLCSSSAAMMMM
jgi:hypothetical protein